MQHKIFLIFLQFIIFCNQNNFTSVEALIGHNIHAVEQGQYTFVVCLAQVLGRVRRVESIICSGSLVTHSHVLTSEHCFDLTGNNSFVIIATSNEIRNCIRYSPNWWISYNQWAANNTIDSVYISNDIAILKLIKSIPAGVILTSLSTLNRTVESNAVIVGWGELNNNQPTDRLRSANVEIVPNSECGAALSNILGSTMQVPSRYVCTKGEPYVLLSDGDSGGPLLYRDEIFAINRGILPNDSPENYRNALNMHLHINLYSTYIELTLQL